MKLEQSFEVQAPLKRVWEALIDVERVAPCLPGAEVSGRNDDGSYNGTFKVKIGPTAAAYSGKLLMEQVDEAAHTATMDAQGTDRRGQGGAKATIVSSVSQAGPGTTRVQVATDYHITGRLARFGRGGMIEEISNRLLNEFAKSLQEMLAGGGEVLPPSEPAFTPKPGPAAAAAAAVEAAAAEAAAAEAAAAAVEAAAAEAAAAKAAAAEAAAAAKTAAIEPESATEPESAAIEPEPAVVEPEPAAAEPEPAAAETEPAVVQPEPAAPYSVAVANPVPASPRPPEPGSEPIQGLSLIGSVIWSRVKSNPAPLIALVIGFLVALRVLRRRG